MHVHVQLPTTRPTSRPPPPNPLSCRFVVTQQRQAVAVGDPVGLAAYLELLVGSSGLREELEGVQRQCAEVAQRYDTADDRLAG